MNGPRDEDILAIVGEFPDGVATYVIHGALEQDGKGLFLRRRVLGRLHVLERAGKVERSPTGGVTQLHWRLPRG
jgi:hypothetical protein